MFNEMQKLSVYFVAVLLCAEIASNVFVSGAQLPANCFEATQETRRSGVYLIQVPAYSFAPFNVYCNEDIYNGGWTVIQRRLDGEISFDRNWTDYKRGFGDLRADFFIGLDKLNALTTSRSKQELLIVMTNDQGLTKMVKYDDFAIGTEAEAYELKRLGVKYGKISDALRYHQNRKFSTRDRNSYPTVVSNCAASHPGGWWFNECIHSNLNGQFNGTQYEGITWIDFNGDNQWATLTYVQMLIRPQRYAREVINYKN